MILTPADRAGLAERLNSIARELLPRFPDGEASLVVALGLARDVAAAARTHVALSDGGRRLAALGANVRGVPGPVSEALSVALEQCAALLGEPHAPMHRWTPLSTSVIPPA